MRVQPGALQSRNAVILIDCFFCWLFFFFFRVQSVLNPALLASTASTVAKTVPAATVGCVTTSPASASAPPASVVAGRSRRTWQAQLLKSKKFYQHTYSH